MGPYIPGIAACLIAVVGIIYTASHNSSTKAINTENRLATLEAEMRIWQSELREVVIKALMLITPKGNPIDPERWKYLVGLLQSNSLTSDEAQELKAAMLEQEQEAQRKNDQTTLLVLGLGLALLALLAAKK